MEEERHRALDGRLRRTGGQDQLRPLPQSPSIEHERAYQALTAHEQPQHLERRGPYPVYDERQMGERQLRNGSAALPGRLGNQGPPVMAAPTRGGTTAPSSHTGLARQGIQEYLPHHHEAFNRQQEAYDRQRWESPRRPPPPTPAQDHSRATFSASPQNNEQPQLEDQINLFPDSRMSREAPEIDMTISLPPSPTRRDGSSSDESAGNMAENTFHELVNRIARLQSRLEYEQDRYMELEGSTRGKLKQLEENEKFWREGFATQGKSMLALEQRLAACEQALRDRDELLRGRDRDAEAVNNIRIKEYNDRMNLRSELNKVKAKLAALDQLYQGVPIGSGDDHSPNNSALAPIGEEEDRFDMKQSSSSDQGRGQGPYQGESAATAGEGSDENKTGLNRRLSLDSLSGSLKSAKIMLRRRRSSIAGAEQDQVMEMTTSTKSRHRKNLSADNGSTNFSNLKPTIKTEDTPRMASQMGLKNKLSLDNLRNKHHKNSSADTPTFAHHRKQLSAAEKTPQMAQPQQEAAQGLKKKMSVEGFGEKLLGKFKRGSGK